MAEALGRIRVLDLTAAGAMIAGSMLAKLGADVVAVEPPAGSPSRLSYWQDRGALWSAFAAGKRGITCDLRSEKGCTAFAKLARSADVIITGGDLARHNPVPFDWEALRRENPHLIHVSITPFGEDGPKANYAATDLILWAAAGPLLPSRDGESPPLRISSDQALLHAGSDAAVGALAALAAREITGRGQKVTVSAQESVAQATLSAILATEVGHHNFSLKPKAPKQETGKKKVLDLSGSGARTRRSKWQVKDGVVEMHLAMGPAAGRFTNALFAWLSSIDACETRFAGWDWIQQVPADLQSGALTEEDMEAARANVAAALARFTKDELLAVTMRNRLILAPVMTIPDLAHSPHLLEREAFVEVEEDGVVRRIPSGVTGGFPSPPRGAPALGQHNAEIYAEIGLDAGALATLREEGVL